MGRGKNFLIKNFPVKVEFFSYKRGTKSIIGDIFSIITDLSIKTTEMTVNIKIIQIVIVGKEILFVIFDATTQNSIMMEEIAILNVIHP